MIRFLVMFVIASAATAAWGFGVAQAMNIVLFYVWGLSVLMLPMLSKSAQNELAKQPPRPVTACCSWTLHAALLLGLVWDGRFITGAALAFAMACALVARGRAKELRAQRTA